MREDHIEHNASGCVDTVVDSVRKNGMERPESKMIINIKR